MKYVKLLVMDLLHHILKGQQSIGQIFVYYRPLTHNNYISLLFYFVKLCLIQVINVSTLYLSNFILVHGPCHQRPAGTVLAHA